MVFIEIFPDMCSGCVVRHRVYARTDVFLFLWHYKLCAQVRMAGTSYHRDWGRQHFGFTLILQVLSSDIQSTRIFLVCFLWRKACSDIRMALQWYQSSGRMVRVRVCVCCHSTVLHTGRGIQRSAAGSRYSAWHLIAWPFSDHQVVFACTAMTGRGIEYIRACTERLRTCIWAVLAWCSQHISCVLSPHLQAQSIRFLHWWRSQPSWAPILCGNFYSLLVGRSEHS